MTEQVKTKTKKIKDFNPTLPNNLPHPYLLM
jgi:hypothetical protein